MSVLLIILQSSWILCSCSLNFLSALLIFECSISSSKFDYSNLPSLKSFCSIYWYCFPWWFRCDSVKIFISNIIYSKFQLPSWNYPVSWTSMVFIFSSILVTFFSVVIFPSLSWIELIWLFVSSLRSLIILLGKFCDIYLTFCLFQFFFNSVVDDFWTFGGQCHPVFLFYYFLSFCITVCASLGLQFFSGSIG